MGPRSAIGAHKHHGRSGMNIDISMVVWAGNRKCKWHLNVPCVNGFVGVALSKEGFEVG